MKLCHLMEVREQIESGGLKKKSIKLLEISDK